MTIKDVYDSLNEEQKDLVNIIVSIAVRNKEKEKNREIGALKRKIRKLEKTIENKEDK